MTTHDTQQAEPAVRGAVLVDTLDDPRFRVVTPFEAAWYEDGGDVVAVWEGTAAAGVGSTLAEAVRDLQAAVAEDYLALAEYDGRQAHDLQATLDVYRGKVARLAS